MLDGSITAVAGNGDELWAITGDCTLWRTEGETWRRVAQLLGEKCRCVLLVSDGAYVGMAEAHLTWVPADIRLPDRQPESIAAFDRAPGREAWYTPWGGPPDTRSLSAGRNGTVYANVHVGGILRSDDGDAWTPTIDIDADVHQVLAHPDRPGVVLAACAVGLARSEDRGDTWAVVEEGLHGTYLRAVAVAGDTTLVTASTGPFSRQAAVYRLGDRATAFERCTDGLPEWFPSNIDTHCLAAAGSVAAFGTSDGRVFRSIDAGATWSQVAEDLPPVRAVVMLR